MTLDPIKDATKQRVAIHEQRKEASYKRELSKYKDGLGKARKARYDGTEND